MTKLFTKEMLDKCIMTPQEQALVESCTCPSCGDKKFITVQVDGMVFYKCRSCEHIYVLETNKF